MKMSLSKLEKFFFIDKLIIHSLDLSLYQASVVIEGQEYYVSDEQGLMLKALSVVEMQKKCSKLNVTKQYLRHTSAYDEMVGGPTKGSSNALEVLLLDNEYY
ncbi:hypothetical protein TW78_18920 [Vibrio coralliilyticus]|uniref:Uncharacterized protein n=1 Tax=Vibrio coralliilyticus TaxID=190893 RepID=A0A0A0T192_9VIBR|nr:MULTISPECIES: DUF6482 family protein [Vibrio]AIW20947.1 hypothetical protein IX92_18085 [Vibrio coralliilyticus]ARC94335.1 hypothetical protein B6A42_22500 [Vibrio coralliilyticus]EEX32306.1 hypothetical protein VIC_003405 [Vibrio coralliilyticus ATCC BAA-450]KJY69413.1 hypothetical protein TW78_18920 [Vibrio coralliilyticus]MCM5508185.1 hypothetical protein [Vibrio sp. SCSIO 43169]